MKQCVYAPAFELLDLRPRIACKDSLIRRVDTSKDRTLFYSYLNVVNNVMVIINFVILAYYL